MTRFSTLAINIIKCFPFIMAVYVVYRGTRGILSGEMKSGKGGHSILNRHSNPVQFWLEVAGHFILAAVLVLFGLALFGCAPGWFVGLMEHGTRVRR